MVTAARGPDVELQRLRQAARADDAHERTRALRELLRMDWRRARAAVLGALADGAWGDRALVLRALAGRGDPLAKSALPHAEAAAPDGAPAARALAEVAAVLLRHDQPPLARALCERGLALAGEADLARARARHVLGAVMMRERDARGALAVLRDAAARYEALGERGYEAQALDSLGSALAATFDLAGAEAAYRQSLALKEAVGDRAGQAITLGGLGRLALQRGDLDEAADFFSRDLAVARELGDDEGMAVMANQLGEVRLRQALEARRAGDDARAAELVAAARGHVAAGVEPTRRGGSLRDEGYSLMMQGRVALAEGRRDEADRLLAQAGEAFAVADEAAARHGVALLRAEAARERGDLAAARAHVDAAIAAFEAAGSLDGQVRGWMELALQLLLARSDAARRDAIARAGALAERLPASPLTRQLDAVRALDRVAEKLTAGGFASPDAARAAVQEALTAGRSLGAVLLRRGVLDGARLGAFLREGLSVSTASSEALAAPSPDATARLPYRAAERLQALPLALAAGALEVAVADPLDEGLRAQLALLSGAPVTLAYAPDRVALGRAIHRAYGRWLGLDRSADPAAAWAALLSHAAARGASMVVLDPARGEVSVRLRVDGVACEVDRVAGAFGAALGEAAVAWAARREGPPASSLPALHGARVSVSLTPPAAPRTLAGAGFAEAAVRSLTRAAAAREGLVAVIGDAGSGRSATLRALLATVDVATRTALLLDAAPATAPEGVTVVAVGGAGGPSTAEALRAIERQDAEVVAVDGALTPEDVRLAVALAARGRLVLVALSSDVSASPGEALARWGVPEELARAVLVAAVTQRLVRRLCPACRVRDRGRLDPRWLRARAPADDLLARLEGATFHARSAAGCDACGGVGYAGVSMLYGLSVPGDPDVARGLGAAAVEALVEGVTSRAEVARVLP